VAVAVHRSAVVQVVVVPAAVAAVPAPEEPAGCPVAEDMRPAVVLGRRRH